MSKWFSQLLKEDKKIKMANELKDIRAGLVATGSPSLDWACHGGFPMGKGVVLYGPEGSSKSTLAMIALAKLQKENPDALGVWFDAEYSFSPTWAQKQGVDLDRLLVRQGNIGSEVFDFISQKIKAQVQEGAPYKFICIDSVKALVPPKEANQDSTGDHQIGDLSKFLNIALRSIVEPMNENEMMVILINQANINMDPHTGKYKPYIQAGGMSLKHWASLVCLVEKIGGKDAKLFDEGSTNMNDTQEVVGNKIRVKVEKSRAGGEGRVAEFTLHFERGIINIGEEVSLLGINQGVIQRPNNITYVLPDDKKFKGAAALIEYMEQNPEARYAVMEAIYNKKRPEKVEPINEE